VVPAGLRPGGERQPIIVAVDGLASAAPALRLGFDTAALWSLPLRVLHAGDEHDSPEDLQDRRRTVEELLAGWKAADPDVAVEVDVVQGQPVEAIRNHAEHGQLMIVARAHEHRLGSWGRSVASAVLDHCRCPLAVVPESPLPDLGTRASVAPEEALSVTP
jgi:nucleotide-binding universal stress UspA family protein